MSYRMQFVPALILLWPPAWSPQMPAQPCQLVIKSEPAGATVTINGTVRDKPTNVTFIVTPGTYKVSVGRAGEKTYCAVMPITLKSPGQTAVWLCSGTAWVKQ